jgi:hypothetical protein
MVELRYVNAKKNSPSFDEEGATAPLTYIKGMLNSTQGAGNQHSDVHPTPGPQSRRRTPVVYFQARARQLTSQAKLTAARRG